MKQTLTKLARHILMLGVASTGLLSFNTSANELDLSGSLAGDVRFFPTSSPNVDQEKVWASPSLSFEFELVNEWNDYKDRITVIPFARLDAHDKNRSHFDLREANWLHIGDGWDFVIGLDKVYWGVTESRHLVNIINQDDALEDLDGEDKLGQPMINLNLEKSYGTFSFFVLPGFRKREFLENNHRLSGPLKINANTATFDAGNEEEHIDFAARWQHYIGDWEIGLSHFNGTSREPRLIPSLENDEVVLTPHYDQIDQTGLDVQYTRGATLWKVEAMTRTGQGKRFGAFVAGFEHTLFGVINQRADLGIIMEYLYDDRDQLLAPITTADNDIFTGFRLALNDTNDTSILIGGIIDHKNGSTLLSMEAERRLGESWKIELESRFFVNTDPIDPTRTYSKDSFITLRLSRFF